MKKSYLLSLYLFLTFALAAQNPKYQFLHSGSFVQDKNFYLFTLVEQLPAVQKVLAGDEILSEVLRLQKEQINKQLEACTFEDNACKLALFIPTPTVQNTITERLATICSKEKALQHLVQQHMRPSGVFIKYDSLTDGELLKQACLDAYKGMQLIVDTYGLGKKGRYPKIDSLYYDPNSFFYQRVVKSVTFNVQDGLEQMNLFFQPTLSLALTLLDINYRDEAGRHEPMELLENRKAYEYIPTINWDNYQYACILQTGHGPEKEGIPLSPLGKIRLKLVAERFHKGWAPLIILSGGYVHPIQTPFAEATEMKRALIENYGIPERAILIEPHARHTTTNFRNAARLMFRYGIPMDKVSVCTTTFDQIIYITDPKWAFDERNQNELGYLPYEYLKKVSRNDVEFKPVITSLHVDPLDPLDP